jgi:hypothetical protein
MSSIKWTLEPDDIEWTMDWSKGKGATRRTDGKGPNEPEQIFEKEGALAHLLMNRVIFLNNHWWEDTWPDKAKEVVHLGVNCNDVFSWGCADSEELMYREIKTLYDMWKKDPMWGSAIWCMIKRKEMPQRPVEEHIRKAGIWDLDELRRDNGLRPNYYDGISALLAKMKYDAYATWCESENKPALPRDKNWWEGWKQYTAVHPAWRNADWDAAETEVINKWKLENGFQ